MLYQKREVNAYTSEFNKRFVNFCEKAPLLLSYSITPQGVQVVNEMLKDDVTKESILLFDWDYTLSPKEFIYAIKQVLKRTWYPKLVKKEIVVENTDNNSAGEVKQILIPYTIDKIIIFKDLFILENEITHEKEFYHFSKNSYLFVKHLKDKDNVSPEQLGEFFFTNAQKLEKNNNNDTSEEEKHTEKEENKEKVANA
ncbi:MAG TPA: hypothetical protein PLI42_00760 [Candidatus Pacearchaeota archaeon]|nr:hypothetical protein [Candidatus Pacearchaeota archaeon]HOS12514.1 hypothetical protein [Candidatus Pacearchaeota archaeon]